MKILNKIRRLIFGYRKEEVLEIVETILNHTYDKQEVGTALKRIDSFDVEEDHISNKQLKKEIIRELRFLVTRDKIEDRRRIHKWKKYLEII